MEVPRRSNEAFLRTLVRELLAQRGAAVCAIASALLDNFIVVRQSLPVKTPITRREVTNSSAVGGLWRSRQVGIKRDSVRVSDLEMRIAAPLILQVTQNGDLSSSRSSGTRMSRSSIILIPSSSLASIHIYF